MFEDINTLVFEGGNVKGISYVGALHQYTYLS